VTAVDAQWEAPWLTQAGPARWMLTAGRNLPEPRAFFTELPRVLAAHGIPVSRLACGMPTLHPQVHALTWVWSEGDAEARAVPRPHGIESTPEYTASPIAVVDAGAPVLRRRLAGDGATLDFPILRELAGQGFTDYLVYPLVAPGPGRYAVTWATRAPGGFDDTAVATLRGLEPPLSLVLQRYAALYTNRSLLETYLGATAAGHVQGGRVLRGDSEDVEAVLWYCDLRSFTAMSEARPRAEVIAALNEYFASVGEPVERWGGEILKLIGDAVLAVFPLRCFASRRDACRAALSAAAEAFARMARLQPQEHGVGPWAPLRFALALHLGDVFFGNVGTPTRLDFTVIGPAVNLVCRLSDLGKSLGRPLLVSEAFAREVGAPAEDLGAHLIRGVSVAQRVFAPAPLPLAAP
jgi:adenylate cyclase